MAADTKNRLWAAIRFLVATLALAPLTLLPRPAAAAVSGLELVKDINLVGEGSEPGGLVNVGGTLFFVAWDAVHGRELWKSDGTETGTVIVKDIWPGSEGSDVYPLTDVGGTLFFAADDGTNGRELWKSDGTETGTVMVKDIGTGASSSWPEDLAAVGSTLFFRANDGTNGYELWVSDGTAANTEMVKDIRTGADGSYPSELTDVGGTLFFVADDGTQGRELWKSEGDEANTVMVEDIRTGSNGSEPNDLTAVGSTLFFRADDGTNGYELWVSDGTEENTKMVKDIYPGEISGSPRSSYPLGLTAVGTTLYFSADDGTHGRELWKSDGTEVGTEMVKDIWPGSYGSDPGHMTDVDGTLYFSAYDSTYGYELWKSDGTLGGTEMVKDIQPGSDSSAMGWLTAVGSTLFFRADDGTHGRELWKSDGTPDGTEMVKDIFTGVSSEGPPAPQWLTAVGATLYLVADDGIHGYELWRSDGTETGTALVADINQATIGSWPEDLADVNGTLFFGANDGIHGEELWKSDGTPGGTVMVKDICPGSDGSEVEWLMAVGDMLYFAANDGYEAHGRELWVSDGTAGGTEMVKDIWPGSYGSNPFMPIAMGGKLYFGADDGTNGSELWVSDGTEENTVMVKDINDGEYGSSLNWPTVVGDTLYFAAHDGTNGEELWMSDGTEGGTVMVEDINPEGENSYPSWLTAMDGKLYFEANDGTGEELWVSDGTTTEMVMDINPGGASSPQWLLEWGGTLYFTAYDSSNGYELWTSDGTAGGTEMFKDINTGTAGSNPTYLTGTPAALFFVADDGTHGPELWVSDGTAGGTTLVKDINPGAGEEEGEDENAPYWLTDVNGILYFTADDGTHGTEVWSSDGTETGTALVEDIRPGDAGSEPERLTASAGTLFLRADDGQHGSEVWRSSATDETPPELTVTGAMADGEAMAGDLENGYVLPTTRDPAIDHLIQFADETTTDEPLADAYFGLYLVDSTVPAADLEAYYEDRGVPEPYFSYLIDAAHGSNPFVYIRGSDVTLVDAAKHDILSIDVDMTVPDDYPLGSYTVEGVIADLAGNETAVTLILIVDDGSPPELTITGAMADGEEMEGSLEAGYVLRTTRDPAIDHLIQFAEGTSSDEPLADDYFGLYLVESTVDAAGLKAYYDDRGVPEPYLAYLKDAADGINPFVYIRGSTVTLVDAAQHDIQGIDVAMTVPDDYPLGTYTVEGVIEDPAGNNTTVTLILIVSEVGGNTPPAADDQSVTTDEDVPVGITLTATDADDDELTFSISSSPSHGTLGAVGTAVCADSEGTWTCTADVTYTPDANDNDPDSFAFTANDGTGDSNTATVSIIVNSVNDEPELENDEVSTSQATPIIIDVLANDEDVDGDGLTVVAVTAPGHGTAVVTNGGSDVTYTPEAEFCGSYDSFTYEASDGAGGSSFASVTVNVTCANTPPVAEDQSVTTDEDVAVVITLTATDADGDELTFSISSSPSHGTLGALGASSCEDSEGTWTCTADVTYTPDENDNGADSFTFEANDGTVDSNTVTVSITIDPVDDLPVAVEDTEAVAEDALATTIDVLANDTDVDGGSIAVNGVTQPDNGTVAITNDGADLTYEPDADYCNDGSPTDDFTYTLAPGSSETTVKITVTCVDDAPVAADDTLTVQEDASATTIDVLGNDTDIDGGDKYVDSVTQPANGTVVITNEGTDLTYEPDPDYCNGGTSTDDFTYTLNGGSIGTVAVTVVCVNDSPICTAQSGETDEDTTLNDSVVCTDVDGDALSYEVHVNVGNGDLDLESGGSFTYDPEPDFDGSDGFVFKASDGHFFDTASYTINVIPVNDAPVAEAGGDYTGDEGSSIEFTFSCSDADEDDSWQVRADWGDGTDEDLGDVCNSGPFHAYHTYTDDGTYTVAVTATDADEATHSDSAQVTVLDLGPTAAFSWSPEPQDEGSAVQFTDESTSDPDAITAWSWDFADLGTSTEQNPSFTFNDDGTYNVCLTVTDDDGNMDEVCHDVTVEDLSPTADFTWAPEPQDEGSSVAFTDASTSQADAITAWSWDFAGLGTSTEQNPSFTFNDDGTYEVCLTVTDGDESTDIVCQNVTVVNVAPVITLSGYPYGNQGTPYTLDLSAVTDPGDDTISACTVDWGDGNTSACLAAIDGSLTHAYLDAPESYAISIDLTDEDDTYSDVDDMVVMVLPAGQATDGGTCISDRDPGTPEREFRLLFIPDVQMLPAFKLIASNPGQFRYSVFHAGGGETATIEVTIPYPFVTQGATPVQAYSSVSVYTNEAGETCYAPVGEGDALAAEITLDSYDGGDSITLTFTDLPVDPDTGLVYLTMQLDYGLKGPDVDANGDSEPDRYDKQGRLEGENTYYDAVNFYNLAELLVEDRHAYEFSSNVDPDGDTVVNQNEFKETPGVAGFVFEVDDDGNLEVYTAGDLTVRLVIPKSVRDPRDYLEAVPDEDGWYMIEYKHVGKPTNYRFEVYENDADGDPVGDPIVVKTVRLKGNEFAEVHIYLDVDSGGGGGSTSPATTHYVSALQPSTKVLKKTWNAMVLVAVVDQDDNPVLGAQVSGIWTGDGIEEPAFCVTDESGTCQVTLNKIDSGIESVSFYVTDVFVEGSVYTADADGAETDVAVSK